MTKNNFTIMQRMIDIANIPTATYGEDYSESIRYQSRQRAEYERIKKAAAKMAKPIRAYIRRRLHGAYVEFEDRYVQFDHSTTPPTISPAFSMRISMRISLGCRELARLSLAVEECCPRSLPELDRCIDRIRAIIDANKSELKVLGPA